MDQTTLIVPGLVLLAAGCVFYALVYPYLSGSIKAERRQRSLTTKGRGGQASNERNTDIAARRQKIAESLKELEEKSTRKKAALEDRIAQAGLDWSKSKFYMISAIIGIIFGAGSFLLTGNPFYGLACLIIGGLGLPNWFINYKRKRRINKFIDEFPNAIDVIIRGVKAGLPLADCLRVIASEAAEPVRGEFRYIVETQSVGMPLGEAIEKLAVRVPVPEANFFALVIGIQQKSGGNLSEALGNLSRVLRDRKKMKAKIKAVSAEAKASASIIASLPFAVGGLVYATAPGYISLLWTNPTGRIVMGVCALWMLVGVLSMRKMINFDM
ncbi:type II secretion system F family protein [Methylocella sp. CPCC 101449]|jgi:tight adherence protein B|uniref:type II secretion system F family protein n=1 Tax=Methylocella sp. CPCC 101449 TaxID=2987531 RepID=UPI00288FC104|nr:type II secretion system F family protein [Methylocella sp. CPCC 101449]MDT2019276.1 type II secretion system F family protein [Methylocella sp. CPCC 101449]HEV2573325.1 type II secretion system F family protein [Beijerinckiaceae bacterium]